MIDAEKAVEPYAQQKKILNTMGMIIEQQMHHESFP